MDEEFVKLLAEQDAEVQDLLAKVQHFRIELRQKVNQLKALIDVEKYENVEKQGIWRGPTTLLDIVYQDIRVADDLLVTPEAMVTPHGWEIQIFPRSGDLVHNQATSWGMDRCSS